MIATTSFQMYPFTQELTDVARRATCAIEAMTVEVEEEVDTFLRELLYRGTTEVNLFCPKYLVLVSVP